jgi:hypothetical protein
MLLEVKDYPLAKAAAGSAARGARSIAERSHTRETGTGATCMVKKAATQPTSMAVERGISGGFSPGRNRSSQPGG